MSNTLYIWKVIQYEIVYFYYYNSMKDLSSNNSYNVNPKNSFHVLFYIMDIIRDIFYILGYINSILLFVCVSV